MKNRFLAILLSLSLAVSFTACGSASTRDSAAPSSKENTDKDQPDADTEASESEATDSDDLDALGDIEVDKGIFNVELTIPAEYVEDQTQEDLDEIADSYGYQSITLNADGSATYKMTKSQHEDLLDEYRTTISEGMDEMISSEDYPNITKIEANDNFTEFTVTTKSTELDMNETLSTMVFFAYGGMYSIFTGESVDNISVTFVNADSGEVITTSNSKDM